ncbi:MAG: LptF/LptG family permease [Planctomycetales bacterium]|nr:LptF/LptG family permease [Planctomycetales bacterium]
MPIIDRYLIRNFAQALLIFFITFAGLFIVIDGFANLEDFLDQGAQSGGLAPLVARYYGVRSLAIFDRTSGVLTLIAAMFTLTALERHNELTALMAAGISRARLAKPLIGAVIAVSVLAVANRELLLPQFREQLSTNAQDFGGERARSVRPQYDYQTDVFLNGRSAFLTEGRIEEPRFRLPLGLSQYGAQLAADEAVHLAADGEHPQGFLLKNVTAPADVESLPSLTLQDRPVLLMPSDTPWLGEHECFVATDVELAQLADSGAWRRFSSTWDMIAALRNPSTDFGPDVRVAVHARMVQPLLDITLLFLGLPLVLTRENRNIFVAIGMCLGVVLAFFVVVMAFHALGNNCLIRPATAAWAPLAVFVPLAVLMNDSLRS